MNNNNATKTQEEDGPLEELLSPPPPHPPPPPPVPLPQQQGWGWGSWSGSALSMLSDLQKAATEAAGEISKNAAKGISELQTSVAGTLIEEEQEQEESKEEEDQSETIRKNALSKLEAASEDSVLGQGLKVLDNSVERFTAGAFEAFGNAWKGSVDLVHRLENQAEQLIHTDNLTEKAGALAPKLIQSGRDLTAKGLKALEHVGRETMDILSLDELERSLNSRSEEEGMLEEATFDRCFYIYGGPEHLEELEALGNHYTLLCNRAKAKMSGERRAMFDGLAQHVHQVLTLGSDDGSPQSSKGKQVEKGAAEEVRSLREASVSKAAETVTSFSATVGGLAAAELVQKTTDRIEAIKAEGVHRLSELCAVCISHLVGLARTLTSRTEDDGNSIAWPEDCLGKAVFIRGRAQDMASELEAVTDSFTTGIADVVSAFQAAINNVKYGGQASVIRDKAHALSNDLQSDGGAAETKLQDALQQLAYVVLSTSL